MTTIYPTQKLVVLYPSRHDPSVCLRMEYEPRKIPKSIRNKSKKLVDCQNFERCGQTFIRRSSSSSGLYLCYICKLELNRERAKENQRKHARIKKLKANNTHMPEEVLPEGVSTEAEVEAEATEEVEETEESES